MPHLCSLLQSIKYSWWQYLDDNCNWTQWTNEIDLYTLCINIETSGLIIMFYWFWIIMSHTICIATILLMNSTHWKSIIQSSTVITLSNIVRSCINNCRNWGRISIRCWIHNRHPVHCPNMQTMVSFVNILEKTNCAIMVPYCSTLAMGH